MTIQQLEHDCAQAIIVTPYLQIIDVLSDQGALTGKLNCIGSLRKIPEMPENDRNLTPKEPPADIKVREAAPVDRGSTPILTQEQEEMFDDNSLTLEFIIDSALFHQQGKYFLRLAVASKSTDVDYGLLKVKNHKDKKYGFKPEVETDAFEVQGDEDYEFKGHKWIFILPKGKLNYISVLSKWKRMCFSQKAV